MEDIILNSKEGTYTCPVCGKVGINNYHNEDIICPCCGSDLSIFRVINNIPTSSTKPSYIWKGVSVVVTIIALFVGYSLFSQRNAIKIANSELSNKNDSISLLTQEISLLNKKLDEKKVEIVYHKHIVRSGDNLWNISHRYYNTGTRYKEIAQWNNITDYSSLKVGDILIIK